MKIMIVDDEVPIREYISYCIRMAGDEYEIVSSVSRAATALDKLMINEPDVVFADITMPKINGLEMLSKIKEIRPYTQVVMLTCHNDFEYARSAIQNGASNYVLKNEITPDVMKKLLQSLKGKTNKSPLAENIKGVQYLLRIIVDPGVKLLDSKQLEEYRVPIVNADFFVLAFKYNRDAMDKLALYKRSWLINQMLFFYDTNIIILIANIVKNIDNKAKNEKMAVLKNELCSVCDDRIGISKIYLNNIYIKVAIMEALEDMDTAFYQTINVQSAKDAINETDVLELLVMRNNAIAAIMDNNLSEYQTQMNQIFNFVKQKHTICVVNLKEILIYIVKSAIDNTIVEQVQETVRKIEDADHLSQLEKLFEGFFGLLSQLGTRYSKNITCAVEYLKNNYKEDITLQEAAKSAYLNKEYFSRSFKKEVGMNFSEYLLKIRLEEGLRLLKTARMNISDIAAEIGISNVSYFAMVFKKKYGVTPNEMRKKVPLPSSKPPGFKAAT